jgi:uncharacterized protein (TIGR00369 family)
MYIYGMYKTVAQSQTTIVELMTPNYANFGGKIHGGHLLSLIDKVAYVCAAKHAENYCVTVAVDTVEFHHPVNVGELLHLHASVNYVGKSSLVIGIKIVAENIKNKTVVHTNSCYVTMVSVDENGQSKPVYGLSLVNPTEVRRFIEAKKRKEAKKEFKKQFAAERETLHRLDKMDTEGYLKNENCEQI